MKKILLYLRHLVGWNMGYIVTEYREEDLWVGFNCECGKVHDWHRVVPR